MKPLTDLDMMPWGKHQGTQMQDVPASYLFFMWTKRGLERETATSPVADYIKRNLDALKKEWPDGIW